MSKRLKVLMTLLITLFTVIVSSIVIIKMKMNPELIRASLINAIETNVKGAEVKIKSIDYTLGTSVYLELEGLEFKEKNSKKNVLSLNKFSLKIPILAILTGGGTISLIGDSPELSYLAKNGKSNLDFLVKNKEQTNTPKAKKIESKASGEVSLPSFITNSKVNLKLTNVLLALNDNGNSSNIKINKINVKNLNLKKSTAYDLQTTINYALAPNSMFKTKVNLTGELMLKNLLKSGEIKTSTAFTVSKTSLTGLNIDIPNIKGHVKLSLSEIILAKLKLSADDLLKVDTQLSLIKDKLSIEKIGVSVKLERLIKSARNLFKLPFPVNLNGSNLDIIGNASLDIGKNKLRNNLTIKTTKPLELKPIPNMAVIVGINGKLKNGSVNLNLDTKTFGGSLTASVNTFLNPLAIPKKLEGFKPVNVDLKGGGFVVSKSFIQKTLYKENQKKKAEKTEKKVVKANSGAKTKLPLLPKVNLRMDIKNIMIGKAKGALTGKVSIHGKTIKGEKVTLSYGKGAIANNFKVLVHYLENMNVDFSSNMTKINTRDMEALLPPYLGGVSGTFSGLNKGTANIKEALTYNVSTNIKGENGDLKDLDINSFIDPLLGKMKQIKGKIPKISSKFDSLIIQGNLTQQLIRLKKMDFIGHSKGFTSHLNGKISMEDKFSEVKGVIYIKELEKDLNKSAGVKDIPIKLSGDGFVLLPEVGYTTSKLANKIIKKEIKKKKKKLKKNLEKQLQKKAKDLLRGFKL